MNQMIIDALKTADAIGFEKAAPLARDALIFREEVRAMCRADRCRSYGRTWSCPPGCGTLDEIREKVSAYTGGILVETIGEMEDEFDFESIERAAALHKKRFEALTAALRGDGRDILPMGAERCTVCRNCT